MILSTRILGGALNQTSSDPIIVPGNKLVQEINLLFTKHHSNSQNVFVSVATDKIKGSLSKNELEIMKALPTTKTDGLLNELPLFIGMPVFLTKNISTELGLTNGTTGIVRSIPIQNPPEENTGITRLDQQLSFIIIEFKDVCIEPLDGLPRNHVPIFPLNGSFTVQFGKKKVNVKRVHFPLVPAFACTAHKSQGQTLSKVVVDLVPSKGMKNVDISFSYVPLSRVRTLNDLTILRPFDMSVMLKRLSPDCHDMMNDFRERDMCRSFSDT